MIRLTVAAIFLVLGFIVTIISAVGILKFPDFLTRLHASSVGETMGIVLMGIGFILYEGASFVSIKIVLIILSVFLVNPVGTHLISKAALRTASIKELEISDKDGKELKREEIYASFDY